MKNISNRKSTRVSTRSRCWCESGRITLYGQLLNLSEGGCFVRTPTPLAEGSVASLRWELEDAARPLDCKAVVAWSRSASGDAQAVETPVGMGLRFEEIHPAALAEIQAFINHKLQG